MENSVTLLGIEIDNEKHVTALCQKSGSQLNALSRIRKYTGFQEIKMLLDSFIFSNSNYCPLVWYCCCAALSQKIEKTQEHALRLLYNDNYSNYKSLLLKAERPTMEVSSMKKLAIEVCNTSKYLNPDFMHIYLKKGSKNRTKTTNYNVR